MVDGLPRQFRLFPKRRYQRGASLHAAQFAPGNIAELSEVMGAEVRQRMVFQVAPDVLHRLPFGCAGRHPLELDPSARCLDKLPHQTAAMSLESIPDDEQLLANGLVQRPQELDDLRALDRAGEEPKVETIEGDPSDRRELMPIEVVLKDGCLAFRRPGTDSGWTLGEPRLVHKDDYAAVLCGVFFKVGQRSSSSKRQWPLRRAPAPCCSVAVR